MRFMRGKIDIIVYGLKVLFKSHDIHGDVAFHSPLMSISYGRHHLFAVKVIGESAEPESLSGHIDGIRAVGDRGLELRDGTRG